jgi:hypothetical protein
LFTSEALTILVEIDYELLRQSIRVTSDVMRYESTAVCWPKLECDPLIGYIPKRLRLLLAPLLGCDLCLTVFAIAAAVAWPSIANQALANSGRHASPPYLVIEAFNLTAHRQLALTVRT